MMKSVQIEKLKVKLRNQLIDGVMDEGFSYEEASEMVPMKDIKYEGGNKFSFSYFVKYMEEKETIIERYIWNKEDKEFLDEFGFTF